MKTLYFAGPLFKRAEQEFNLKLAEKIEQLDKKESYAF